MLNFVANKIYSCQQKKTDQYHIPLQRTLFQKNLVLYNDDVNTFNHVIKSLVEICGHDPVQAEQCAIIVHFKGSCEVKSGVPVILAKMSRSLNLKGLNSRVCPKP